MKLGENNNTASPRNVADYVGHMNTAKGMRQAAPGVKAISSGTDLKQVNQFVTQRIETDQAPLSKNKFITEKGDDRLVGKNEFLAILKERVYQAANETLKQINQTADDCPYITKWFHYYADQDPAHIEQAISMYAPATASAATIEEYMGGIVARVTQGLQNHVQTGSINDVPKELVEVQHKPEDFLHIIQKAQLANLCGNQQAAVAAPAVHHPPSHNLFQGFTAIAQPGDRVANLGTTSCGLVLGFGANGIACFHWPFMTDSPGHHATFNAIVAQVGQLHRIEIITNDFPDDHNRDIYIASARSIRDAHGVSTGYYVRDGKLIGDPMGTLAANHFNSMGGGLRQVPL